MDCSAPFFGKPARFIQLSRNQLGLLLYQRYPKKSVVESGLVEFQHLSVPLVLIHGSLLFPAAVLTGRFPGLACGGFALLHCPLKYATLVFKVVAHDAVQLVSGIATTSIHWRMDVTPSWGKPAICSNHAYAERPDRS
jgi:hypothetical protein